jgi:hypothetical protein
MVANAKDDEGGGGCHTGGYGVVGEGVLGAIHFNNQVSELGCAFFGEPIDLLFQALLANGANLIDGYFCGFTCAVYM